MCGIAGIVGIEPSGFIKKMLLSIEHRGRDDEGVATYPNAGRNGEQVCFGHRRLAIIDTSSAGHQPMTSPDGRFSITFNGEIYNYRELRDQLKTQGHRFHTDTDTEVLLAAFAQWGPGCLERLNGMFAFAIWDQKERTLTLARDHVGIKPLYFTTVAAGGNEYFLFASEIKALLASGIVSRELEVEALDQYLTFLWTPDPLTLFRGIRKLPPAHLLQWKAGELTTTEWWDVSYSNVITDKDEEWWREQVLATMDEVVKLEMVADVPLGSFLSGGIDSSAIVAMMKHHANGSRISTYTIGTKAEDLRYDIIPDDLRWARRVNQELRTDNREIMLEPDVAQLLPQLVYQMDEPIADPAIISSYLVSRAARETLTVLLSGVGGDEVFAGYPRYVAMKLAGALEPIPGSLRRPLFRTLGNVLPGGRPGKLTGPLRNAKKFSRSASLGFEERYLGYGTYFSSEAKASLYSEAVRTATSGLDPYREHRRYFERQREAAPLNRLLYVDLKTFLPCLNLAYTDKTSMAVNLEVRVPFLNRKMIELTAQMPPRLKLNGLRRKYILKRALENVLPRDVVWRKKAGFGAPIRSWLRGALRPLVDDLLADETVRRRGLFRPAAVKQIIEANLSGREDYNLQVFQLLTLELWQRAYLDGR